jgi:hypothetical protein
VAKTSQERRERGIQIFADLVIAENFAEWTEDARGVVVLDLRDPI